MVFLKEWQLTYGSTRLVLLTEEYAFKFPRFCIVWTLKKFLQVSSGENLRQIEEEFVRSRSIFGLARYALYRMFFAGLHANLRETVRWLREPSVQRTPVLFAIPGLLVIMPRREPHPLDNRPQSLFYAGNHARDNPNLPNALDVKPANMVKGPQDNIEFCDYGDVHDPIHV